MQKELRRRFVFFYQNSCEVCAEVEAQLQAYSLPYLKVRYSASPEPGKVWLWYSDTPTLADEAEVPATPALWDRQMNFMLVGDTAIARFLSQGLDIRSAVS